MDVENPRSKMQHRHQELEGFLGRKGNEDTFGLISLSGSVLKVIA